MGEAKMGLGKPLLFAICAAALLLLAAMPGPASAGGAKVYKGKTKDIRVEFKVKGGKVSLVSAKYGRTCRGTPDDRSSYSAGPEKIKQGGRFRFLTSDDFGQFIHIEMNGRIKKGTIRGNFSDSFYIVDQVTGDREECWTGKSARNPDLKFKASLVK